jgi:hypothetical protein
MGRDSGEMRGRVRLRGESIEFVGVVWGWRCVAETATVFEGVGVGEKLAFSARLAPEPWLTQLGLRHDADGWRRYADRLTAIMASADPKRDHEEFYRGWAIGTSGWRRAVAKDHQHLALRPGIAPTRCGSRNMLDGPMPSSRLCARTVGRIANCVKGEREQNGNAASRHD